MVKLTDVTGIGPVTAKLLSEHKIKTVEALASMSLAELKKIPGLSGDIRARAIKKAATDYLQSKTVKQLSTSANSIQTTVTKVARKKAGVIQPVNPAEEDEVKDKDKKKNKKDDKKEEKDKKKKDRNKKKDKKKNKKKKGKDKKKS
ncbi:MAG: helix-hairpin-helix domain-containing protein [Nitrosomonas sp.]|nr:helix-hairpin-helix domain-containing protein [Nitrosomonas sp.]